MAFYELLKFGRAVPVLRKKVTIHASKTLSQPSFAEYIRRNYHAAHLHLDGLKCKTKKQNAPTG